MGISLHVLSQDGPHGPMAAHDGRRLHEVLSLKNGGLGRLSCWTGLDMV